MSSSEWRALIELRYPKAGGGPKPWFFDMVPHIHLLQKDLLNSMKELRLWRTRTRGKLWFGAD